VNRVSSATTGFDFAVGAMYVRNHFDEESKTELERMVANLALAFKDILDVTEWMDDESREAALGKVDAITSSVAYPDWLLDDAEVNEYFGESDTIFEGTTHVVNVKTRMEWYSRKHMIALREAPDKTEWVMSPHIVNAYYMPTYNSINFLAGILNPPMYGRNTPRYLNYGAIGMVMGHEITHGFDDQGRQYDGAGNLDIWWTQPTIDQFTVKAQCFVDQYNKFCYEDLGENVCVNGANTQGENIADAGGIHESFLAYDLSVADEGAEGKLPGLMDYSPEQLFFISYSQAWCMKFTDAGLTDYLQSNVHSPGRDRVIGPLQNSPDFAEAFECAPGTPMNPDPEARCDMW
jgi:predicted metalloendopeptidase